MVDPNENEQAALRAAVRPLAETFDEIGWQTRLQDLSEGQVFAVIKTAVTGFQDALRNMKHDDAGSDMPF